MDYRELFSGETTIAFASITLRNTNLKKGFLPPANAEKPLGVEIVFVSDSITADFQKAIAAGAKEFEGLTDKPWGQKVGYVLDNNGFLIEICTPIKT